MMKSADDLWSYPKVVSVECWAGYRLAVGFDDGRRGVLDMTPLLGKGMFRQLRDVERFKGVLIAWDTAAWKDKDDGMLMDLNPAWVYHECVKGGGGGGEEAEEVGEVVVGGAL